MKRLVLLCDGTWNSADQKYLTNVRKMRDALLVRAPDGTAQRVYYQEGVGTRSKLERLPGLFGAGLWRNVQAGYCFVAENYDPGDELFLFGFSRGAYTARSIAGMLRKAGVLRRDRLDEVDRAYKLYKNRKVLPSDPEATGFRRDNSLQMDEAEPFVPNIKFVGVWDTVGALGVPLGPLSRFTQRRHNFHDVALSRVVQNAYHAVAIDERRADYRPTLWEQHPDATQQRMEQRWFAGVHGNVGGGANDSDQSDRSLRWMIEKAQECGLAFDLDYLSRLSTRIDGPLMDSMVHVFRLRPLYRRPIGKGVPVDEATYLGGVSRETVDPAVIDRNIKDASYMPPNLVAYYREFPEELELAKKLR
jgi:uncharacterized protein (DUF2235 family)